MIIRMLFINQRVKAIKNIEKKVNEHAKNLSTALSCFDIFICYYYILGILITINAVMILIGLSFLPR